MTEPVEHILWGLQTRMGEIIKLANMPEDKRGSITREAHGALKDILEAQSQLREAHGALKDILEAQSQLREAKRALFDPEVSP